MVGGYRKQKRLWLQGVCRWSCLVEGERSEGGSEEEGRGEVRNDAMG